jgi:hypothetical protein
MGIIPDIGDDGQRDEESEESGDEENEDAKIRNATGV